MPAFDTLQPAGFGGLKYPTSDVRVVGGLRDHVHEYPHSPGGAPEKLGRKLYEISMTSPFHNTFKAWPKLWPETLKSLRDYFEAQVTTDLVIPTIGTIRAYCFGWTETMKSGKRSGVDVEMMFREDQSNEFLVESLISAKAADVSVVASNIVAEAEGTEFQDLFDGIQDLTNDITSIADQVNLQGDLLDAKLAGLKSNVTTLFSTVTDLSHPKNHAIAAMLRSIAVSATEFQDDLLKKQSAIVTYVTPRRMSVTEVSIALYANTEHAMDVMQLNALDDPFAIPQSTALRVYSPELAAAA